MQSQYRPQHEPVVNTEAIIVFSLAIASAILIKLPALFGLDFDQNGEFYFRNFSLFTLPFLVLYFNWKSTLDSRTQTWIALTFMLAILVINIYPFEAGGDTEILAALHLPVALWLAVGIAYSGIHWNSVSGRMDFIRFSGELFIYYVLIALSGGVLMGFMAFIFQTIAIDIEPIFEAWILPCGSVGAVTVAAWLVLNKKGAAENLAPMLARLFTPLFTIVLVTFLATLLWTGRAMEIERDLLIALDMILILVIALNLYSISARVPNASPGIFDIIRVLLMVSALLVDLLAFWSIGSRVTEFGFTPNRLVALGLNVLLLFNLGGSVYFYSRFMMGSSEFNRIDKWQTDYLPIFAIWAGLVVIIIPPLFYFS